MRRIKSKLMNQLSDQENFMLYDLLYYERFSIEDLKKLTRRLAKTTKVKDLIKKKPIFLGEGAVGRAYQVGRYAVKLTSDSEELRQVRRLKGKTNNKHIYKIIDVFSIKNVSFIVTPLYQKLTYDEADLVDSVREYIECYAPDTYYDRCGYRDKDELKRTAKLIQRKELDRIPGLTKRKTAKLYSLGFHNLLREVERNNIHTHDAHGDNVMKSKNGLVLIDLMTEDSGW